MAVFLCAGRFDGYQAFEPGEVSPEEAHEIGMQLAKEILGGKYEFVLTTHIDKGHIHNVRPDRAMRKAV